MEIINLSFFLLIVLIKIVSGEDFYALLGLQRQATTRDIRKAFKSLALTLHPDKNRVKFIYCYYSKHPFV